MSSNTKEASTTKAAQPKVTALKSANKRTRQAAQQSAQAAQSDKGKVISPRPPAGSGPPSSAMKDTQPASKKSTKEVNVEKLSVRARATDEAKTIEQPAGGSGSAGQAKRGSRASNSNADLLKQSIRSEKVIKSSLQAKKQKEKHSAAAAATSLANEDNKSQDGSKDG